MARLIPRKQIEEQQDLSGSLRIGGDLIVTGSSLFSGSLQVDNDFFLGNELTDRGEITGSVFLTGSLIIDGELNLANLTRLAATASNALLSVDTELYAGIRSKDFGANLPTLYVSSTDGDDSNDGRSIQYPLRTIKRAASLSTPGYDGRYGFDTGSVFNGYVIKVQAGTYLEDNPVILPKNTSIWGAGLRITKINAKNKEQDLFYVNSGCYIAEVTMGGLRLWPDQINPERGFAVAFQPGAFITTSPYIQNCSQISNQENSFTELYEDIPPGGGGLYVNGDVIDPDSPLSSMVLDAYTQISPNGVGCLVNGRGFIQLVSFFNNFSYYAIRVNNGGQATLNNSNISFGLYGMYSSGSRLISGSGGNIAARDSVRGTWSCIVNVLNKGLADGLPTITKLNTAEGIRLTSPALYTQSVVSAGTTLSTTAADEISSDYKLISAIVDSGVGNFPTLLAKSSNKGYDINNPYNILGAPQITSSISATEGDLTNISASYAAILSILANGTGSFNFKSNTSSSKQIGNDSIQTIANIATNYTSSVSASFNTVINIIKGGLTAKPIFISNSSGSIKGGTTEQNMLGVTSSLATINSVSASFSIVYNVLANGTGSNILPIPNNHQREFTITNVNSSSFNFEGVGNNPSLTLFRGETYKFGVEAIETFGGIEYPFWIRTQQLEGITEKYDYNIGVVNNGDSRGTITFTVPYNAPNTLYYVSQNRSAMGGKINIANSSTTPFDLIKNTLTYPATIQSGSIPKTNIDIVTAYEILVNNKEFIKDEVIQFISSSWADFSYNQATCSRDVGYIIDGVAKDLLYGGNEESIRSGLFYYQYPSEATTTQLGPTLTAVKYAAGVSLNLIRGKVYTEPSMQVDDVWDTIRDNKLFVQNEVITYLSSSWSNFYYNEAKCRRDTGYILDAVVTDAKYGGNERSITAGEYYYQYPSLAIVEGDGDGVGQLGQTVDGIRYAAGTVDNLLKQKTFTPPSATILAAYNNLINNKELIQNETIEFINVAFPNLKYIQATCRRDVGYIIDNVATDLLYGGIERGVKAGRYYYDYPSLATTTQRAPTTAGIRYAKIIGDSIVKNQILETPRIVFNDEKNFKVSGLTNVTSSFSGGTIQQNLISSSFGIIEGIVARGVSSIKSLLGQKVENWGILNPLNINGGTQITSTTSSANLTASIDTKFDIVTTIIQSGSSTLPAVTASYNGLVIVSGIQQITGSVGTQTEANSISSSIGSIINIVINGTGSLPPLQSNTLGNIKVTNSVQWTGSAATQTQATSISSSVVTITNIITNGTGSLPPIVLNTAQKIKVTNTPQYISSSFSGSINEANKISASIALVVNIITNGTGSGTIGGLSLPTTSYGSASVNISEYRAYNLLKQNIPFIQAETIAYLSSSWNGFVYSQSKCERDLGLIISGALEDMIYNSFSSSVVNGKYYYEYPSQATGSQLAQTIDGIKYASKLAQNTLQNIVYTLPSTEVQNALLQLKNNRGFIQSESIAYLSSSWSNFPFTASVCARDIGHIIDAVRTDLVYGGNERSVNAGNYYYLYPSQATGSQLIQTLDGVNYGSRITQKIVVGTTFVTASQNKLNASNLLLLNKGLIGSEVVEYVSSSWFGVQYDDIKCKRDVRYIIDAARTDLVYGGNERSRIAGEFYYLYPSKATVGGVPSVNNQLDPTVTGIKYGSGVAQKIIIGSTFVTASKEQSNVRNLIQANRAYIQSETVEYTNAFYPNLVYNQASCSRDVGFIVDSIATDIVYGGNERSVESGVYYYKFPSKATSVSQKGQTIDSINYANQLVNKIVSNIVLDIVQLSTNTDANIKVTDSTQYTSSLGASTIETNKISVSFDLVTGIINDGLKSFTPTGATYNPANGEFIITILGHTLTKYNSIYIRPESFVFTCGMDGNRTEHKLPGVGQYPYSNKLQIQSVTTNTVTVNVGASGPNVEFTPTNAIYNPANGNFVITVGPHSLSIGEGIVFETRSLAFTCDMDTNQSVKSYPRFGIDPYAVRSIPITAVTATTLTVNAGISGPNKFFTPSSASYNALTGDMVVNVGQHGLGVGRGVVLENNSIAFTCDQDNNTTTHSYPRSGSDPYAGKSIDITSVGFTQHTATNAPHNAATGLVTLTIASHSFINGDYIKISDNSLTYTCELDENTISKSYPRPGYDYPSGRWLSISNVTVNTFDINVGPSSYTAQHTFVTASINGIQRQDGTFTINVGDGGSASGSIHTFVSASANAIKHLPQSVHTFVSASAGAIKHLPQSTHTFIRADKNSISTIPTITKNGDGLIKISGTTQFSASVSASGVELDIITSSFQHITDIIENGVTFVPDSLARNYNYGFELSTPTLLHISSKEQTIGMGSYNVSTQITNVSSSYGTVVNVVKNGLSVLPTLVTNNSASLKVTNGNPIRESVSASSFDTNKISSGFGLILNVIENGTSVLPTIISNTSASIKVTDTPQLISGSAAGRLQGKLISSSLSLVIDVLLSNGTSSIGFKPSNYPIANTNSKINSAYNLLISNSKFIVDETIAYMSSSWSGFNYTQSKCERDLTGILSGSAFDLLYGGNSASLFNGKFYFDYPSQATGSQLDQTITAIKYASGLAEKVVLNIPFTHISASINQPTSASWNSLRKNKGFIQSESIAYLSSSWSNFDYNEVTCKRDIGYVIDAVATDLLYGGNERSVVAGRYYYDYPSQATTSQLEPTLGGIRYAKGVAMGVVINKEVFTSSLETQYAYDSIKVNKIFIQSESVAFVNSKYPNLEYSESKCYRDLGYIIDGVATDLLYGGNERSRDNGDYYYQFPSQANGSGSQTIETVEAIKYASRITTASISDSLIPTPQVILNTSANIKVTDAQQYILGSYGANINDVNSISASISIVTNIIANGTGSLPVLIPYTTPSVNINTLAAYDILKNNISFIVSESIAYLSSSWSTASYDESKCRRDLGFILSGSAEDLLFNANSASIFNGAFYYDFPSQAQGAQLNQTLDGINYASRLAQKVVQNVFYQFPSSEASASHALIRNNREFIQNETIAYLSSSWSNFEYSQSICKRDITHIIDAVSTDILYGGNERSTNAGNFYYLYPSQATTSQLQPTLDGVKYAGQVAKNVAQSLTFVTASQLVSASVYLLRNNREFIQNETLAYLTASWSTFEYDKVKCKRDVGYIVDGVTTDLLYGGNERSSFSGEFYYKYPSLAIVEGDGDGVGQLGQTVDGINYASRIAQKIVNNIVFVTASLEASASFDLLRKNKGFIAEEVIGYVSSSWSGVFYNQTTCKRDVGYLIDAAATDILYGGNERSVIAGQYYYEYPSRATNKGVPSEQNQLDPTLTGIRYGGKLATKVITNPTYLTPSASLLVTAKLLTDNKQLIQKETITFLSSSWSGLKYNEVSCSRDLGFIIDAIRTDLVYGGNERSIEAGSYYYKFPSVAIVESYGDNNGQKKQTVDGIDFARGISEKIVANTLLSYLAPITKRRQAAERLKAGKDELKQRAIGYTNGAFPYLVYNEASCSRDTGFIVDAAVTDLLYGGNERGIKAASSYYDGQYGSGIVVTRDQLLETLETNRYLRTRAEFIAAGAPLEVFGSLIVATGIDYSYNGSGVTFKALPPNQGGSGVADPAFEITELGGGRIFFTSGNQDGDFRIGTGLSINQATGTLVGRTFSKSLFSLVTPFSLALQI